MLGYFWMAFLRDQFKANFYNKAFFNDAEKYAEAPTYLIKNNQLTALDLVGQNIELILLS
jgi:hypothetical protein